MVHVCMLSPLVRQSCLTVIPWTVARWASLTEGFPRKGYWSGLPFPSSHTLWCLDSNSVFLSFEWGWCWASEFFSWGRFPISNLVIATEPHLFPCPSKEPDLQLSLRPGNLPLLTDNLPGTGDCSPRISSGIPQTPG